MENLLPKPLEILRNAHVCNLVAQWLHVTEQSGSWCLLSSKPLHVSTLAGLYVSVTKGLRMAKMCWHMISNTPSCSLLAHPVACLYVLRAVFPFFSQMPAPPNASPPPQMQATNFQQKKPLVGACIAFGSGA